MNLRFGSEGKRKLEIAAFGLLAVIYVAAFLPLFPMVQDDAYITFKYGRTLAETGGLLWNPGEAPVEGYTSTLWMLMSAVCAKLSVNPVLAAKSIGIFFGFGLLAMILWAMRKVMPSLTDRIFIALFMLSSSDIIIYSVCGMENFTFMVLTFALLPLLFQDAEQSSRKTVLTLAGLCSVLCWLRPEGHAIAIVLFFYFIFGAKKDPQRYGPALLFLAVVAGTVLPLHIARIVYFKSLLPNTYYAKHSGGSFFQDLFTGMIYLSERGAAYLGLLGLCVVEFLLRGNRWAKGLIVITALFFLYSIKVGGDDAAAFPGLRLVLPVIPFLFVGTVCFLRRLLPGRRAVLAMGLFLVLFQISQLSSFFTACKLLNQANNMTPFSWRVIVKNAVRHGRFLLRPEMLASSKFLLSETPKGGIVALPFAGRIPYETRLKTIDLLGLNDRHIALQKKKQRGLDVKYDAGYVLQRKPYFICETFRMGALEVRDLKNMTPADYYAVGAWKVGQRELLGNAQFQSEYVLDRGNPDPTVTCFRRKEL